MSQQTSSPKSRVTSHESNSTEGLIETSATIVHSNAESNGLIPDQVSFASQIEKKDDLALVKYDEESMVLDPEALPDISYQSLYQKNQSHYETRLHFERLQTKRNTLLLKSLRNKKRFDVKEKDDARLLRHSPLSGPPIINTPLRLSVGGRPATMPGTGLSKAPLVPDHFNPMYKDTHKGRIMANVHKSLAHGALILSGYKLQEVPKSIFNTFAIQTGCVKSINLSKNNLTHIPCEMQYFCNITLLNLSYNKLMELPNEICQLKRLKVLRLQTNNLWCLPPSLQSCCSIEILDCSNNALAELPGNVFHNMTGLKEIYLNSNRLVQLPGSLARLKNLEILDLNDNEIMTLALCPVVQNIWDGDSDGDLRVLGNRDWIKFVHPESGAISYFNMKTKESRYLYNTPLQLFLSDYVHLPSQYCKEKIGSTTVILL